MKSDYVFGVVFQGMTHDKKTMLLFEVGDTGLWTLPGGAVGFDDFEEEALSRWLLLQYTAANRIVICDQLGPLHTLPNGKTAKVFVCLHEGEMGDVLEPYDQCRFFERDDLLTAINADPSVERMIWDGFSIRESWTTLPKQLDRPTAIFCEPGKEHVLVEETNDERREWPRLNPKDGLPMRPS